MPEHLGQEAIQPYASAIVFARAKSIRRRRLYWRPLAYPSPEPRARMSARFLFAAAQAGAERPLKNEIAREHPELRFAFSRPGFVTFRVARRRARPARNRQLRLRVRTHLGLFARQSRSGRTTRSSRATPGESSTERLPSGASRELQQVHVWRRERALPGDEGYETGSRPSSSAPSASVLLEQRPDNDLAGTVRQRHGRRGRARARLRARRARRVVARLAPRRFARDTLARRRAADRAAGSA